MSSRLIMEGGSRGPNSKYLQIKAREAVHRFLEQCGYNRRQPAVELMGGRTSAFEAFQIRHAYASASSYIGLWVDSEDPVADIEKPWEHLVARDGWQRPADATDDQVLLMITCMETWIVSDRPALREHFGAKLQENRLPPVVNMEVRHRHDVQDALCRATEDCTNAYAKGRLSFEVFARLSQEELASHLPSFRRFRRILDAKL